MNSLFVLLGVLSPGHRLYETQAAGFLLFTANPCAALIRTKIAYF